MKMIQSFNPSLAANGSFKHQVGNPCGGVYLFNESNQWIQLTLPDGGNVGLPAWWARFYKLEDVQGPIEWLVLDTIATVASPLSKVYGESYERSEIVGRNFYDGPIPRNPYIANNVSSSVSTTSVQNDGNPAVTTFIEATQVGNTGGSNVALGNDGSFIFAQWVSSVFTQLLALAPGASPVLKMGKGLVLQAVDNSGANLSNIFGIDSSGNTFLQAHATNNQVVIYDKNGNNLLTVDANKALQIPTSATSLNGTTAGSVKYFQFLTGTNIKALLIFFNGYQNNSVTEQHLALPAGFTQKAIVINANGKPLTPYSGNTALTNNARVLTTLAAAGGSTTLQNAINGNSVGFFTGAFDGLGFGTSQVSTATDIAFVIGF